MLLQVKHQKYARALKEGGEGTKIFIFLSEKLLHFFLGLCDYSDKFPKMFCSSCGGECPSTANFSHQCGQQLNLSQEQDSRRDAVDDSGARSSCSRQSSSPSTITFSQFKARKEEDRRGHFRSKRPAKRTKVAHQPGVTKTKTLENDDLRPKTRSSFSYYEKEDPVKQKTVQIIIKG